MRRVDVRAVWRRAAGKDHKATGKKAKNAGDAMHARLEPLHQMYFLQKRAWLTLQPHATRTVRVKGSLKTLNVAKSGADYKGVLGNPVSVVDGRWPRGIALAVEAKSVAVDSLDKVPRLGGVNRWPETEVPDLVRTFQFGGVALLVVDAVCGPSFRRYVIVVSDNDFWQKFIVAPPASIRLETQAGKYAVEACDDDCDYLKAFNRWRMR